MQPRVIGLDLSLTATGVALPGGTTKTLTTKTADGDRRLAQIAGLAYDLFNEDGADLAVIEDLPTHARSAGITGMVHGAVRVVLLDAAVPYVLITPATLKKYATGKGNATKADMRMALYKRAATDLRDDNQVDAWWLRHAGLDWLGRAPIPLPRDQRDALAKVTWPEAVARGDA